MPEIAIVESNTLACLGLRSLLETLIPAATIRCFRSFGELMDDTPDMYVHYFVSSQIYFGHTTFFMERRPKTIVLFSGEALVTLPGIPTLNIFQDEKSLAKTILQLHQQGHHHPPTPLGKPKLPTAPELSAREVEVMVLLVRGLINKEIAHKLGISLSTVISHRKNIAEKLGIKSLSALTIYAVMHGFVEADSI